MLKDLRRLTRVGNSEDQDCCIGAGLGPAVAVVDVDSRFAEPRCGTRQFANAMLDLHLRNLSLDVIRTLAIENRFGHCRIVHHEADSAFALLVKERLIRENIDVLFGQSLAELGKRKE